MDNNYLVTAKNQINEINKRMENGEGFDDYGLCTIAEEMGLLFEQVKAYVESF